MLQAERQLAWDGGISPPCELQVTASYLLARALLGAVKKKLGLAEAFVCCTAAAPMPVEVASYFGSLDIDLLDVYGMSECTGAASMS